MKCVDLIFSSEKSIALLREFEELSFYTAFAEDKVFLEYYYVKICSGNLFEPFFLIVSLIMEIKLVNRINVPQRNASTFMNKMW